MRIAFDAQPLLDRTPTGVGRYEAELLSALLRKYDERLLLTYFIRRSRREDKARLAPFTDLGAQDSPCRFLFQKIYNIASRLLPVPYSPFFPRTDISHFFNYSVPAGVKGCCAVTVYDMVFRDMPETMEPRNRRRLAAVLEKSLKRAQLVVTISEFSRQRILHWYDIPPEQVVVVPCGVDTQRFHPLSAEEINNNLPKDVPPQYLLYLGTLEPRKNLCRLLDAYALLRSRCRDLPPLVLAGVKGWESSELYRRIGALGGSVIQLGFVPSEQLVPLICGAEGFLFPSLYEGFGLPPLEAMACGVPVLTSNAASMPEVVGECAVLTDPLSTESIADGIERLLSDSVLRRRLCAEGQQRAAMFTWERAADILHDSYKSCLGI